MKHDRIEINEIDEKLRKWHLKKYGSERVDLQRSVVKLLEEAGELARAILKGDIENAKEECADVAIIVAHIARGLETSLFEEMIAKYHVLEKRLETGVKEKRA